MSRFEELQAKLETLSPVPVNMPKLYLLGDTGAGKTTIVRKILDTDHLKFPSVQQKRTTVAVTEYILSKDLPFQATYIFKTEKQISGLVQEILDIAVSEAYKSYKKGQLVRSAIIESLEETPDERFRLRYILSLEQLEHGAIQVESILPKLDSKVTALTTDLDSNDEELSVVIDLALQEMAPDISQLAAYFLENIKSKVAELCDGYELFSDSDHYQHTSDTKEGLVIKAKALLSSAKNSVSPVVEYARIQGNFLASWMPTTTELVLIDGEGIGHDTREASHLSARHLDYFHFADSIVLVEESGKPFASGGKSALLGIGRNGYLNKFSLIFSKLDEVEVVDGDANPRGEQIRLVGKGLTNVKNALKEEAIDLTLGHDQLYYLGHMKDGEPDKQSVADICRLVHNVNTKFNAAKPQFVEPIYDFEMLSSYLAPSSNGFLKTWLNLLNSKPWQTVKAFNRRMCWEMDEYRDMRPVSDFHVLVTKELNHFFSNPQRWGTPTTATLQRDSLDKIKQEFSKLLLDFGREIILSKQNPNWEGAMSLGGTGSTAVRLQRIRKIIQDVLPDHKRTEAVELKDSVKDLVRVSVESARA